MHRRSHDVRFESHRSCVSLSYKYACCTCPCRCKLYRVSGRLAACARRPSRAKIIIACLVLNTERRTSRDRHLRRRSGSDSNTEFLIDKILSLCHDAAPRAGCRAEPEVGQLATAMHALCMHCQTHCSFFANMHALHFSPIYTQRQSVYRAP